MLFVGYRKIINLGGDLDSLISQVGDDQSDSGQSLDNSQARLYVEDEVEFSASEVRVVMQKLFPHRKLVLSQFTFFMQVGIARPSGKTFRRGRRCYRLEDLLPIATVLALKEEGIPFKNISDMPELVHNSAAKIFSIGAGCRLSGHGPKIDLTLPGSEGVGLRAIDSLLSGGNPGLSQIFWSLDVGLLAEQLQVTAAEAVLESKPKVVAA